MAVNITSSPKTYSPANWPMVWGIELTDLGTPPTRKDLGYYLAEEGGTRITEDAKYKPFAASTPFYKDFSSVARGLVYTSFPTESATQQTDSNILKRIKLKYGEVSFNSTTCVSVKTITSDSNVINAINANVNADTHSLFGTSSGFTAPRTGLMLHQRPTHWKLLHGSKDYVWFLGVGQIVLSYWNGATQIGSNQVFNLTGANTVKYVCLDYALYGITTPPTHLKVFYSDGVVESTIQADYCCCAVQDDYMGVLFLEPFGGRSMMATGPALSTSLERQGQEIFKPIDYSQTQFKTGGTSALHTKGVRKLTFRTEIEKWPGYETFLNNFCSSPGHHLQKGYSANTKWEKFVLEPGSTIIREKDKLVDFQFSGYASEFVNTQQEDI